MSTVKLLRRDKHLKLQSMVLLRRCLSKIKCINSQMQMVLHNFNTTFSLVDFDDMSCEMVFGQEPPATAEDPAFKQPCYKLCKISQRPLHFLNSISTKNLFKKFHCLAWGETSKCIPNVFTLLYVTHAGKVNKRHSSNCPR